MCPWARHHRLQLLLNSSVAACAGQLPVWLCEGVWRWSRRRLIKSRYACSVFVYDDRRERRKNNLDRLFTYQKSCNKEVLLVMTRMMHDGTWWQALWHTSICIRTFSYTTHRHSLCLFVLHPGSTIDFHFPSLSLNQERHQCLSLPLVFRAHRHTHTHSHSNTVRAQAHKHLHPETDMHTHAHRGCLLPLWWLRAVKTSLLSLPLSYRSSLTELVYAGSQRLLPIRPESVFLFTSSSHSPLVYLTILILLAVFGLHQWCVCMYIKHDYKYITPCCSYCM